ncbi:RTA1 like protein [Corynespora cassiicola Philippines]|uniref:RTA1 like protein n=1 Tax=Corynespora cassiicola Philippines TaxID=1448308 RepID=A0A2T2NF03_CORCC|nr:RTA1 like protein [Corynespora cassiicola Philippines]
MPSDTGIYQYEPSVPAALIATVIFLSSALFHTWQMCRKRTWFYTALVSGGYMMGAGYGFRMPSAQDPSNLMFYIAQSLLIILPPSLYAATIYMIYGRIVLFVRSPEASVIRPELITKIFVCGDIIAFFMQAGGGGMMAQSSMADLGQKVILIGLFVQLIFFGLFVIVAFIFWKRMRNTSNYDAPAVGKQTWQALFKLLIFAAAVIILRCIFRVIEFGQGHDGYLVSNEIYMYIFDTLPMAIVQVSFHAVHAGNVFVDGAYEVGMKRLSV